MTALPERGASCGDAGDTGIYGPAFTYSFLSGLPMVSRPLGTSMAPIPKTISIPAKNLNAMTNMERQYWEVKSAHYDVVIFWKKGKFYELYDGDAVLGHKEFGLKMTMDLNNRGKMRMSGVPEQSFAEWSRLFVHRGYRVGRVEQMIIDDAMIAANGGKEPKTIPRELVAIHTRGTVTEAAMLGNGDAANFIIAFASAARSPDWCDAVAVDLSRGERWHCPCPSPTAVSVLLHHLAPVEVLIDAAAMGDDADLIRGMVTSICQGVAVDSVHSLPHSAVRAAAPFREGGAAMPPAWHALVTYFAYLRLDVPRAAPAKLLGREEDVDDIAFRPFTAHLSTQPPCRGSVEIADIIQVERREDRGMEMDASALESLELVRNLRDGSSSGTLLELLTGNRTASSAISPMGKRRLRQWLLRPSAHPDVIAARQQAVQLLGSDGGQLADAVAALVSGKGESCATQKRGWSVRSTDFERVLARLSDIAHEDTRVAFIDPLLQYKRHLGLLREAIHGFTLLGNVAVSVESSLKDAAASRADLSAGADLLRQLFAPCAAAKAHVESVPFDEAQIAQDGGFIFPAPRTDADFDGACESIATQEAALSASLDHFRRAIGPSVKHCDLGKELFLLEVPATAATQAALKKAGIEPGELVERARTTKTVKFMVTSMKSAVSDLNKATVKKQHALVAVLRRMATALCSRWHVLFDAADRFSYFECLESLSRLATDMAGSGSPTCFPTVGKETRVTLNAKELYHPVVRQLNGTVVSNDVDLDEKAGRALLLTGPNMAGKSTLMRTLAVTVILAQLGSAVGAAACNIGAPVDRVFTRIGARDASHRGFSTLRVEMEETAEIHRHATSRSLCVIDELGRGTSTHDGAAIASSSFNHFVGSPSNPGLAAPLLLFSTHYHTLALNVAAQQNSGVQLGFMDFHTAAPKRDREGVDQPARVTFLYKLTRGICGRSYGVEVAIRAGIPADVVTIAARRSKDMAGDTADAHLLSFVHAVKTGKLSLAAAKTQALRLSQISTKGTTSTA